MGYYYFTGECLREGAVAHLYGVLAAQVGCWVEWYQVIQRVRAVQTLQTFFACLYKIIDGVGHFVNILGEFSLFFPDHALEMLLIAVEHPHELTDGFLPIPQKLVPNLLDPRPAGLVNIVGPMTDALGLFDKIHECGISLLETLLNGIELSMNAFDNKLWYQLGRAPRCGILCIWGIEVGGTSNRHRSWWFGTRGGNNIAILLAGWWLLWACWGRPKGCTGRICIYAYSCEDCCALNRTTAYFKFLCIEIRIFESTRTNLQVKDKFRIIMCPTSNITEYDAWYHV